MKKKLFAFILLFVVCVVSTSCSNEVGEETVMDYSIIDHDGEHIIVFDDISTYQKSQSSHMVVGELSFPSMKDFKESVTEGKLTKSQKEVMARFIKDENGNIPACDFNNLYVPKVSNDCSVNGVSWEGGNEYDFSLSFDEGGNGFVQYLTESRYNSIYEERYGTFFERKNINVTASERLDGNKDVTYYSTSSGDFKRVRYTLNDNGRSLIVDRAYRLRINHDLLEASKDIPSSIEIYCVEGDVRYYIWLTDFVEDPTDDWLMQFGMERFDE